MSGGMFLARHEASSGRKRKKRVLPACQPESSLRERRCR